MKDLFSLCGINCGHCPSYEDNLLTDEDRQRCSEGWHKYQGIRPSPERLLRCEGCPVPIEENPVRYFKQGCNIRKCAVFNGVKSCAYCSAYPCQDLARTFVWTDEREERAAQLGEPITEEDYLFFFEAFDNRKHLAELRASLGPEDIVAMKEVSIRPKLVDLPDDLPFSGDERAGLVALHQLIGAVEAVEGISYARQLALKKKWRDLLKILWAFGRFGQLSEEGWPHLVLDSKTYLAQKIHSHYSRVKDYFKALAEYGVRCEHVPLMEERWLTPTEALRKEGWFMTLSFDGDAGGAAALRALQNYAVRLGEEHGKGAYRYFSKVDMRLLSRHQGQDPAGRCRHAVSRSTAALG